MLFMKLQYSGEVAKSLPTGIRPAAMASRPPSVVCSAYR